MIRQDYDPSATYKARRYFTIGERKFNPGDPVPRGLVSQQVYARMFQLGKLRVEYDTDALHSAQRSTQAGEGGGKSIPAPQTDKASVARAVQTTVENIAGASSEPPLMDGYRHVGRGWYEVAHGENRQKVRTEDAAAALYATWAGNPVPAASFPVPGEGGGCAPSESILDLARDAREAREPSMAIQRGDDDADEDDDFNSAVDGHGNEIG